MKRYRLLAIVIAALAVVTWAGLRIENHLRHRALVQEYYRVAPEGIKGLENDLARWHQHAANYPDIGKRHVMEIEASLARARALRREINKLGHAAPEE